ncbi:MAG: hypothetical protein ACFCVC_01575, partial [Acidimicrobiia bacterium]
YLMFCAVYTLGFVIAWSWILNLGILARQRSLVIPFILVIFAYGWYDRRASPPEAEEPARYDDLIALTPR